MEHEKAPERASAREGPCRCAPGAFNDRGAQGGDRCARCRGLVEGPVGDWSGMRDHREPVSGDASEGYERRLSGSEDVPKPPQNSISDPFATGGPAAAPTRAQPARDDVPEAPDDDPALTGPLGLRNDAEADEAFLKGVMERLAGVQKVGKGRSAGGYEGRGNE